LLYHSSNRTTEPQPEVVKPFTKGGSLEAPQERLALIRDVDSPLQEESDEEVSVNSSK